MATLQIHRSGKTSDFLTFSAADESYLKGSFHRDAQRTPETRARVWCEKLDALRRRVLAASLPLQGWLRDRSCKQADDQTKEQSIQRWRDVVGDSVSDGSETRTSGDDATASKGCRFSIPDRT